MEKININYSGVCICGCGKPTKLADTTRRDRGDVKGLPRKYAYGCKPIISGKQHYKYKGGVFYNKKKRRYYVTCIGNNIVPYSRVIAECYIAKRPLTHNDIVHHINGNPSDDSLENLEITNRADHARHHNPTSYTKRYKRKHVKEAAQ